MTSVYLLGLVGHPVAKSLSPPMHKAALKHCQLDGDYELFDVREEKFSTEIERLKLRGLSGFNVTIPYKLRILQECADRSPTVERVGAANTIKIKPDGSLYADNTDISGFAAALKRARAASHPEKSETTHQVACVLGAGGAAKAALEVLSNDGYERIYVFARDASKATKLCLDWKQKTQTTSELIAVGFEDYSTMSGAQLFVSTIPYGQTVDLDHEFMRTVLTKSSADNCLIFDMVYSRDGADTALVKLAKSVGLNACDGTSMLVNQALKAFEIWTNCLVPFDIMHDALISARKSLLIWFVLGVVLSQMNCSKAMAASEDEIFSQYQRQSLDLEHSGDKKKALETIQTARKVMNSLAPYSDKMSQLRVREAELQLQTKQTTEALNSVQNFIADKQKIVANAAGDGDLAIEIAYLKDLLLKFAQESDNQEAFELAHKLCISFKLARCRARDTLLPLCDHYIRHKKWLELEVVAKQLQEVSDNPLSKMSSLAMLQLSYEKQGKAKEAAKANQSLMALDPKTPQNERVWHRDMAGVQLSVRNYEQALTEIEKSITSDQQLSGIAKQTQQATDLGVKADIENKLGRYPAAIRDAKLSDKLWTSCNPEIWRSHDAITFSKCHGATLSTLEAAFRSSHKDAEANEIRNHRRAIEYVR